MMMVARTLFCMDEKITFVLDTGFRAKKTACLLRTGMLVGQRGNLQLRQEACSIAINMRGSGSDRSARDI